MARATWHTPICAGRGSITGIFRRPTWRGARGALKPGTNEQPVGAGSPVKRPGLLANFHPPFTVAAATVFAGKPAPTHTDRWWTRIGG
ncbi:hypothetical protein DZA28_14750 [Pseudomonas alloputida]|uniref:Uncharacterized protein n=1 Tax=Pseudomonas alloputida TaxID=1940621 RepID=A0ABY3D6G4_9PSED|nr:hypothetical protein DZA28_14750 [Pseudomonas alloputida]